MNLLSPSLQAYVNNYVGFCGTHNSETFGRNDNIFQTQASLGWWIGGTHGYDTIKNFGATKNGPPYVSLNCSTGFQAAFGGRCTQSTLITATDVPTQTYSSDSIYENAQCTFFNAIHHKDGSAFLFYYNGLRNTDSTIIGCAHVIGGQTEKDQVNNYASGCSSTGNVTGTSPNFVNPCQNGFLGPTPVPLAIALDDCTMTVYHAGGKFDQLEDVGPDTGNFAIGTANHQWNRRAHREGIWLCENDQYPLMMQSTTQFCANLTGCIDEWPEDFIEPFHRITPYPADATPNGCASTTYGNDVGTGCVTTAGGGHDASICVAGTASNYKCVYRVEWSDVYYQSTPDLRSWPGNSVYAGTNTVADLGNACLIVNNESSAIQITAAEISSWCSHTYANLNKIMAFCTPSGYFNTSGSGVIYTTGATNVCSGNSGSWVGVGTFDTSQVYSAILNEYLPPGEMIFLTQS